MVSRPSSTITLLVEVQPARCCRLIKGHFAYTPPTNGPRPARLPQARSRRRRARSRWRAGWRSRWRAGRRRWRAQAGPQPRIRSGAWRPGGRRYWAWRRGRGAAGRPGVLSHHHRRRWQLLVRWGDARDAVARGRSLGAVDAWGRGRGLWRGRGGREGRGRRLCEHGDFRHVFAARGAGDRAAERPAACRHSGPFTALDGRPRGVEGSNTPRAATVEWGWGLILRLFLRLVVGFRGGGGSRHRFMSRFRFRVGFGSCFRTIRGKRGTASVGEHRSKQRGHWRGAGCWARVHTQRPRCLQ